ncbi:MAG: cytochrome c biogenesis protein DipZ [Spirochaetales bacterium]|nr:cytochrome c biogenesis protein DipZ [Spirochaetales bacterium]
MTVLLFFAFLSGIVTILSPCILPVLPIVLSGSVGGRRRPFGVILGFTLSFSIFTLVLSTLVRAFNIPPGILRVTAVILITVFGLVLVIPKLRETFEIITSRVVSKGKQSKSTDGFVGGILVGISLGLVWTPCVGPIMASVISLAVTQNVDGGSILIVLAYSLGTSIPMLAIMLGGRKLLAKLPFLSRNTRKIQQFFGVLMIVVGVSIGFGLDRKFQSAVLSVFPQYGAGLTAFENTERVQQALNQRQNPGEGGMMSGPAVVSFDVPPKNGKLSDYGEAPSIVTSGEWFNVASPDGLDMDDLKGKVVLLDFWTYSCVNCVRTIPHLREMYDRYKDDGLEIIGVHSPEFAFERKPENVGKAIDELGVSWPVVLDNDYAQWQAYNNRYWPAHYFIDSEGRVRYFQFGEGRYDTSEEVIRKLLKESGTLSSKRLDGESGIENESRTPEIYLGYGRSEGFTSQPEILPDGAEVYTSPVKPANGEWTLEGEWTIERESVFTTETGVLELGFHAKNVFLVIEPLKMNGRIEIRLDGKQVGDSPDVVDSMLFPEESRLYQLVALPESDEHILSLTVQGEMRLFAFTFG